MNVLQQHKFFILFSIFLFYSGILAGETELSLFHIDFKTALAGDSVSSDAQKYDTLFTDAPLKNPLVPLAKSTVLPGWGQWDNQKKLKGTLIFLAEGYLLGNIIYLNTKYQREHRHIDKSRKSDFIWILSLVHIYNMVDAAVDAYLMDFDEIMQSGNGAQLWLENDGIRFGYSVSF
ncbi:MAG: hypothetical protein Kow00108_24740 [Calditrichia bacterium]